MQLRESVIQILIFFCSGCLAYSQNLKELDTLSSTVFHNKVDLEAEIEEKEAPVNFYKSDSIFSFRSQKGYGPSLLHNLGLQVSSPFRLNSKQWLLAGSAAGITVALFFMDDHIDGWARTQKEDHIWVRRSSPFVSEFGNLYGTFLVGSIGTLSAVLKNQKGVQTSLLATQAMITSGLWVQLMKCMTGRERPKGAYLYSQESSGKWYGPLSRFDNHLAYDKSVFAFDAFPSGHTAIAFSVATVFATQYNETKLVPVLSYSAATLVGITRLTEHEHWASDVFVGGLIGYLCGKQVVSRFNETRQKLRNPLISGTGIKREVTINQYGNQIGLSIRW